jgi:hypothetical protein
MIYQLIYYYSYYFFFCTQPSRRATPDALDDGLGESLGDDAGSSGGSSDGGDETDAPILGEFDRELGSSLSAHAGQASIDWPTAARGGSPTRSPLRDEVVLIARGEGRAHPRPEPTPFSLNESDYGDIPVARVSLASFIRTPAVGTAYPGQGPHDRVIAAASSLSSSSSSLSAAAAAAAAAGTSGANRRTDELQQNIDRRRRAAEIEMELDAEERRRRLRDTVARMERGADAASLSSMMTSNDVTFELSPGATPVYGSRQKPVSPTFGETLQRTERLHTLLREAEREAAKSPARSRGQQQRDQSHHHTTHIPTTPAGAADLDVTARSMLSTQSTLFSSPPRLALGSPFHNSSGRSAGKGGNSDDGHRNLSHNHHDYNHSGDSHSHQLHYHRPQPGNSNSSSSSSSSSSSRDAALSVQDRIQIKAAELRQREALGQVEREERDEDLRRQQRARIREQELRALADAEAASQQWRSRAGTGTGNDENHPGSTNGNNSTTQGSTDRIAGPNSIATGHWDSPAAKSRPTRTYAYPNTPPPLIPRGDIEPVTPAAPVATPVAINNRRLARVGAHHTAAITESPEVDNSLLSDSAAAAAVVVGAVDDGQGQGGDGEGGDDYNFGERGDHHGHAGRRADDAGSGDRARREVTGKVRSAPRLADDVQHDDSSATRPHATSRAASTPPTTTRVRVRVRRNRTSEDPPSGGSSDTSPERAQRRTEMLTSGERRRGRKIDALPASAASISVSAPATILTHALMPVSPARRGMPRDGRDCRSSGDHIAINVEAGDATRGGRPLDPGSGPDGAMVAAVNPPLPDIANDFRAWLTGTVLPLLIAEREAARSDREAVAQALEIEIERRMRQDESQQKRRRQQRQRPHGASLSGSDDGSDLEGDEGEYYDTDEDPPGQGDSGDGTPRQRQRRRRRTRHHDRQQGQLQRDHALGGGIDEAEVERRVREAELNAVRQVRSVVAQGQVAAIERATADAARMIEGLRAENESLQRKYERAKTVAKERGAAVAEATKALEDTRGDRNGNGNDNGNGNGNGNGKGKGKGKGKGRGGGVASLDPVQRAELTEEIKVAVGKASAEEALRKRRKVRALTAVVIVLCIVLLFLILALAGVL